MAINLEKGQKIDLKKPDGSELKRVYMGLGWDAAGGLFGMGSTKIDLDASCVMLDENKQPVDTVSFRQLRGCGGAVVHSGDNLTGDGDGDDEVISVDLANVPANVKSIVFTVNSFSGQTFDKVKNCFARLVDKESNNEVCIFKLSEKGSHTGLIMAKVYRHNGAWKMAAIGTPCSGRTVADIINDVRACL